MTPPCLFCRSFDQSISSRRDLPPLDYRFEMRAPPRPYPAVAKMMRFWIVHPHDCRGFTVFVIVALLFPVLLIDGPLLPESFGLGAKLTTRPSDVRVTPLLRTTGIAGMRINSRPLSPAALLPSRSALPVFFSEGKHCGGLLAAGSQTTPCCHRPDRLTPSISPRRRPL